LNFNEKAGITMQTETAPTALDIMTSRVQTVDPGMKLGEIVAVLLKHKLSNVPVVETQGDHRRLLGFVSEGDCLEFLGNELFYGNPSPTQTARTIMKKHPTCVAPETDIFTLTSIFTSHRYRHLPVVRDQNLLGIVSRRDVLKSLDEYSRSWDRTRDQEKFPIDIHKIMNHRFIVSGQS
jgi:CBS domain-containing protein